jgi:phosphoglycolate phosphatase
VKYKAVLYDMDGTVLETLADLTDAVNFTLRHFNMPERSVKEVRRFLGNGARRLITLSVPEGTDEETLERVLQFYVPYYNEHCRIKTAPYPGITALMEQLKVDGVKQAVISNKPDASTRALAADFFGDLLELAVGESAAVRRKPAPDMVLAAVRELGLAVDDCVYVGDSEVDIATAKNAGMACISVAWGFRDEPELVASGASLIVRSTEELYEAIK